jgi:hypothetical protein
MKKSSLFPFPFFGAILVALLLFAFYFVVFVLWGGPMSAYERHLEKALLEIISRKGNEVLLKEIMPFGWERVCIVYPYETREEVEKKLGMYYGDYEALYWIQDDACWGLLLVDENNKIIPVRIRKAITGAYPGGEGSDCLERDEALLSFKYHSGVWGPYVVYIACKEESDTW